jgi:hypothetical protein
MATPSGGSQGIREVLLSVPFRCGEFFLVVLTDLGFLAVGGIVHQRVMSRRFLSSEHPALG